jgi:hypothetical protein
MMMIIKRKSAITGITRSKNIPVDPNAMVEYEMGYSSINEALPYLTDADRDFILSGIVEGEWEEAFSEVA